jgi:hypothetical protein
MSTPVISTPNSLAMARSPQFVTGKNNTLANDTLTSMTLVLYIRSGVLGVSGAANYSLLKNVAIDELINFEISDLMRTGFGMTSATLKVLTQKRCGPSQRGRGHTLTMAHL